MNKIKKNFIYLSIYKLLEMLLPLITSPLLSRRLGAASLGAYSYTYSVAIIFTVIAQLGIYNYGMREIAKIRDNEEDLNKTYSNLFFAHAVVGLAVLLVYIISVAFVFKTNKILFAMQTAIVVSIILDNSFLFVGLEEIKVVAIRDAIAKLSTFILIVLLVKKPTDLYLYCAIMAASTLLCKLITLCYARKFISFVKPNWKESRKHLKPMALLMVPVLAGSIYQVMDKIMIEWMYGEESVGYYECAVKALIPRNLITVLGTVLCPHISNLLARHEKEKAVSQIKRSLILSLIMSYIFTFGIITIADVFAPWFWGKDFSVCSQMIIGLSISIPIWTVGEVIRNQYLLPSGRDKDYIISFMAGVITNIVFNCILNPKHGVMGAIAATIISEIVMSLIQYFMSYKYLRIKFDIIKTMPYLLVSFLSMIITKNIATLVNYKPFYIILIESALWLILYISMVSIYETFSKNKTISNLILTMIINNHKKGMVKND